MLDRYFIPYLKTPLSRIAVRAQQFGISANQVTVVGFVFGMIAVLLIAFDYYTSALVFIVINRILDGVDGALARLTEPTDLGGYLDITLDFIFYAGVIFGFAVAEPNLNGLAASFLIFSFIGTGCSFLAYAIMAQKRGIEQLDYGKKSLFYIGGLTEGSETIGLFVLMCLFPEKFTLLAWGFGALCWATTATRIFAACRTLR